MSSALKVLHEELAGTARVRSQFLTEARALQGISHPSVVKVLGVGELPDGRPYLAMEHLDGETLASVLARGPLPLAAALELFDELCAEGAPRGARRHRTCAVTISHRGTCAPRDLAPVGREGPRRGRAARRSPVPRDGAPRR